MGRSSHLNTIQTTSHRPVSGPFSQVNGFCDINNEYRHALQTGSWARHTFQPLHVSSLISFHTAHPRHFSSSSSPFSPLLVPSSLASSPAPFSLDLLPILLLLPFASTGKSLAFNIRLVFHLSISDIPLILVSSLPGEGDDLKTCPSASRESTCKDQGPHWPVFTYLFVYCAADSMWGENTCIFGVSSLFPRPWYLPCPQ